MKRFNTLWSALFVLPSLILAAENNGAEVAPPRTLLVRALVSAKCSSGETSWASR